MQITNNCIVKKNHYKLYHTIYRTKISWIEKLEDYLKTSVKNRKITFSTIIALSSSFIYFMIYLYDFIYFRYYSIDTLYYNPSIQQILSSLVILFLFFIILCFMVFYRYVQNKYKEKVKIRMKLKEFICYAGLLFIFTVVEGFSLIENFTIRQLPMQYIINYMLCVVIYRYIYNYFNKKGSLYGLKIEIQESAKEKGGILVNSIIIIVSIIFAIIIASYTNTIGKRTFKVIYSEETVALEKKENVSIECNVVLYCNNKLCVTTKGKITKIGDQYNLYFKDINQKNNINLSNLSYKKYNFDHVQKLKEFIFF